MEHVENMAGDNLILKIDPDLAKRLDARAKAAGQTVEDYVRGILKHATDEQGFEESETQWNSAPPRARDRGLDKHDAAYWRELEAICDEADRTGGVPWEQVEARLLKLGQKR